MTTEHMEFYTQSLVLAEAEIKEKRVAKALKDVVGLAFENHRKRIWEHFGFKVVKNGDGLFDADWYIWHGETLVAIEEDKGHYLDSCFLERALTGFAKTINSYQKKGKNIPKLIIHSFARYNKFHEKKEEDMETRKESISKEMGEKLIYTTLTKRDRLNKKDWFGSSETAYTNNADQELIKQDIEFILSLIPK